MAGKITNLLREGLPSKIYWTVYNSPIPLSGYKIAQTIQGLKPGKVPQTGKIYDWLDDLKEQGDLNRTDVGYIANIDPLLCEIEKILTIRNITLSDLERYMVKKLLDRQNFRMTTSCFYEERKKVIFDKNIDTVSVIAESIGNCALLELQGENNTIKEWAVQDLAPEEYNFEIKTQADFEEKIELFNPELELIFTTKKRKEIISSGRYVTPLEALFPKNLLEKLCNLSITYTLSKIIKEANTKQYQDLVKLWQDKDRNNEITKKR